MAKIFLSEWLLVKLFILINLEILDKNLFSYVESRALMDALLIKNKDYKREVPMTG
jgi:hypothetical protein